MRHNNGYKKLGRNSSHRKAMMRNLASSLILHGRIETTLARAKAIRPYVEKLITLGKKGDLHARRVVLSRVPNKNVVGTLFHEVAPRFNERAGGYTRIYKTGYRAGDNAPMAIIELVEGADTTELQVNQGQGEQETSAAE
ncbi:50S ribosomal protein L17 [Desulfurispirillum indicum]|uniref:Large ribosomal subunit protein bL17 n=1 Tax=Desulfurispirillum indicum (strain ATCC BAA-1389 / DSM 22839 / S5) TaxID=653733 RepID=E6W738_DESIS|nr:50S ribosomal protein L17 [Desulfurispirillum indicum]ADU65116.1 ribosomal protein L17 [Desulfurispirillum indicum S5]UCZ57018.1 50S ribosomal protein L17 [Desulfurispirillum indicum]